ncbi:hypothetical protein CEXT_287161 [Caerostris extrusa]|uniref:Uncharacterized protein n=1 Tax=Caerostris extrusa TaxID=172846 RepID=A0AAV4US84_CAEEX|nr:hypothetical protein CEXT_287161 [Caerostris extrusa]
MHFWILEGNFCISCSSIKPSGYEDGRLYLTVSIIGQNKGKICAGKPSEVYQSLRARGSISVSNSQVNSAIFPLPTPYHPQSLSFFDIYILFESQEKDSVDAF